MRLQPVEQRIDLGVLGRAGHRRPAPPPPAVIGGALARQPQQLAPQLHPAVLALRQPLQRARLQRQRRRRHGSAAAGWLSASAAGSSGMPIDSRTLFSISKAMSGFSRRNSRALSLPWPIFSPL